MAQANSFAFDSSTTTIRVGHGSTVNSCFGNGSTCISYTGGDTTVVASNGSYGIISVADGNTDITYEGGNNGTTFNVSWVGAKGSTSVLTSVAMAPPTSPLGYEEFKEADLSTRQATHRVSRGIRNKGRSVTRKLKSDGYVDTVETLHNLNQDEVPYFEEEWTENAEKNLPAWSTKASGNRIKISINGEGSKKPKKARSYKKK